MNLRATGLIAWAAMVLIVALLAPSLWNTLQVRKSAWLLLQGRVDEVEIRTKRTGQEGHLLQVALALHRQDIPQADLNQLEHAGTRFWWTAIAAFERGMEAQAQEAWTSASTQTPPALWRRAGGLDYSPERSILARWLAQTVMSSTDRIPEMVELVSNLTTVERRTILAAAGNLQFQDGNWSRSSELLTRAVLDQSRSPVVRARTVATLALDGQYGEARYWADQVGTNPELVLSQAIGLARGWEGELASSSLSPLFDLNLRRRTAAVARATDWMETQQFLENPDPSRLPKVLPQLLGQDPIRLWFAAERLESVGQSSDAFLMYTRLQQLRPTLAGSLRMAQLTEAPGVPKEISARDFVAQEDDAIFLAGLTELTQLGLRPMRSEPGVLLDHPVAFSVTVPAEGIYRLTLLGSGQRSDHQSPIVRVQVQGRPVGRLCIPSDLPDAHQLSLNLPEGEVTIGLEFANPARQADQHGRRRALRLNHLILSRPAHAGS